MNPANMHSKDREHPGRGVPRFRRDGFLAPARDRRRQPQGSESVPVATMNDLETAGTISAYDRLAEEYSRRNDTLHPCLSYALELLVSLLPRGASVLDVGCGTGRDLRSLEAYDLDLVGMDLSVEMLNQARLNTSARLYKGDMRALPFADASFDGVWCLASLLHLRKMQAPEALHECTRVLRTHGYLALGLRLGEGEVWEEAQYGVQTQRFFSYYQWEELMTLLEPSYRMVFAACFTLRGIAWLKIIAQLKEIC